MSQREKTRRDILKLAGIASLPFVHSSVAAGQSGSGRSPNDRIRLGLIGCGARGKYLTANLPPDARITCICDCSLSRMQSLIQPRGDFKEPLANFAKRDAAGCVTYQDYRVMLDREQLDGVIIATPDHHHALPTILACQRNFDVYVEKPLSLTIGEGRAMVKAATSHGRVVQVGSQQRTMQVNRFACEFIRNGKLGDVRLVQLRNYPGPARYESLIPDPKPQSTNSDIDWNLFCGPTPLRSYDRDLWIKDDYKRGFLTWRGWDLFRSYSGHLMTNWGGHGVDMVQYALGTDRSGPVRVEIRKDELDRFVDDMWHEKTPPLGSIDNDREDKLRFAPVSFYYADGTELRLDPTAREAIFHGSRGKMYLSRNQYSTEPNSLAPPPDPAEQAKWDGQGNVARPHLENWLACMRSRKQPHAPIEVGHRTATICHLANIARELGSGFNWDPKTERSNSAKVNALLDRERRKGFELPPQ